MFHVVVGPDRGHACVPALPHNMAAGSVKAMMCTLTSVTVTPAPVSHINFFFALAVRFYKCIIENKQIYPLYLHFVCKNVSLVSWFLQSNVPVLLAYLFLFCL